jgi:hypothetical protein
MHQAGRFPRTLREAFPSERFAAIEICDPDPERSIVRPVVVAVVLALIALAVLGVL